MSTLTNRPLAVPKSRVPPKPANAAPARASTSEQGDEEDLPYEERELRDQAARVLANDELLLWLSRQRNESVLQTRLYCEARAAGLRDDVLKFDYTMDLSEDNRPSVKSPAAKGTAARVVSGSSKNPGSPASGKKDRDRGRRSTGSAR